MQPNRIVIHLRKLGPRKAHRVKVYSLGIDGAESESLGEWKIADYEGEKLADLSTEVHQSAQFDCDEQGGRRKYRGVAYDDTDGEVHRWNMAYVADPDASPGDRAAVQSLELDEPSTQGLLAQTMRHQERTMNLVLGSQERTIRDLQQQLDSKDRRIAQLEKRELDVMELARTLHERMAGDVMDTERNADRIDKGLSLLVEKFLPAAGMQLGLLPEGFTIDGDPSKLVQTVLSADDEVTPPKAAE